MQTAERPRLAGRVARGLALAGPVRRVFARAGLSPTAETLREDGWRLFWTVRCKAARTLHALLREKVLIVNQKRRRCGIYQFGKRTADALAASRQFQFKLVECGSAEEFAAATTREMPSAVIVNYLSSNMEWLTAAVLRDVLPPRIPTIALIHEVFDIERCPPFGRFVLLDPSAENLGPGFAKVGRLVDEYENRFPLPELPTIGSFGFGTNKGFERLVERVQREFDRARIRLRLPFNDSIDPDGQMALGIAARCRALAIKPGIDLEIGHDFLTEAGLLDFLAQNSLNAFLYDESQRRGISSAVDLALAVDRPVAITRVELFRHLRAAWPFLCVEDSSLSQILERGTAPLRPYREAWSRNALVAQYEGILYELLHPTREPRAFR